ncbi:MAG TPA: response regulator [Chthonomonadaceae bacterium]|nr:response regulator [Chthonomonadaceae bacterium]
MTQRQHPPVKTAEDTLSAEYLHDLRTPLNQILGFCEMLTEQAQEEGQPGFLPDLQSIHTAAQELLTLLNNGVQSKPEATPQDRPREPGSPSSIKPPAPPESGAGGRSYYQDSRLGTAAVPGRPQPESPTGAVTERSASGALQALILVVDDNRANRDVLSRRLERQGYVVALAENGRQALDAVRAQAFDLVLLDIMMPEMDGYAVLQQLKADEALRHIPIIMISAMTELDSVVRCIEMGAEDYLPKPFNPTLLKARIGACLEKKHARDRERHLFKQLQQNYKRLQELEKLRDDLTHMIVHDLRTPLASIITGMQTLGVVGDLDEIQHEMVDISISGGETLLGMINNLLDVEKMESGSMQLDYAMLDAAELVASAASQVASLSKSKSLTLVRRISANLPLFRGDADKLRRILVNLLGNAIKFTPVGGTLTVEVRFDAYGQSLVFAVSDTGEGIPSEAFERIFEKFGQVESRQGGRTMSTGLGLTFCKLATQAHGGHIRVESMPGEGSTFFFTIPLPTDTPIGRRQAGVLTTALV